VDENTPVRRPEASYSETGDRVHAPERRMNRGILEAESLSFHNNALNVEAEQKPQ
jgi:hypothetical protein